MWLRPWTWVCYTGALNLIVNKGLKWVMCLSLPYVSGSFTTVIQAKGYKSQITCDIDLVSTLKLMPAWFIGSTGIHRREGYTCRFYCKVAGFSKDVRPFVPQENVQRTPWPCHIFWLSKVSQQMLAYLTLESKT